MAETLGGLPPNKMNCSKLGAEALTLAMKNYPEKPPAFTAKTRIIRKSEPYGIPPLVASRDLPTPMKQRLREILFTMHQDPEAAVIHDLDTVPVNNQFLRGLRKIHPQLHMLGVSKLSYHPGLEEVVGSHLFACLVKPLDVEELSFWLKSISEYLSSPAKVIEA